MGISCKKWNNPKAGWLIGAEGMMIGKTNLRDMAYPKNSMDGKSPNPDTYKGKHWVNTEDVSEENDLGGVHCNSGVQNKWFYLLTDGGEGTNDGGYQYKVTGIGIEKSRQLAYRTLVQYATKTSQYADIRKCFIQAATDLHGATSAEVDAVKKAWDAVGVYENGQIPTGIENVLLSESATTSAPAYNMMGQRVGKNTRGLIIYKGKKYINK